MMSPKRRTLVSYVNFNNSNQKSFSSPESITVYSYPESSNQFSFPLKVACSSFDLLVQFCIDETQDLLRVTKSGKIYGATWENNIGKKFEKKSSRQHQAIFIPRSPSLFYLLYLSFFPGYFFYSCYSPRSHVPPLRFLPSFVSSHSLSLLFISPQFPSPSPLPL